MRRTAIIVAIVIACIGLDKQAGAFSLGKILSKATWGTAFKVINVKDLAAMMAKPDSKVMVFDVNPPEVRHSDGIIPNAHLLPSSWRYDVSELPPDKRTPLVFYCYNRW